jgi:prepilin-type N-terminal cleavage/methylation domain-containing protein
MVKYEGLNIMKSKGFTLIEMLLVMVIIASVIFMMTNYLQQRTFNMSIDRTSLQMQQILNAGLAYYVANGNWPSCTNPQGPYNVCELNGSNNLQQAANASSSGYLPAVPITNPWGGLPYYYGVMPISSSGTSTSTTSTPGAFFVYTRLPPLINVPTLAQAIVGQLPLAYTMTPLSNSITTPATCQSKLACYIISQVNVPGMNLNNATAINFAGVYHHGACVPAPKCPQGLSPQIFVVPLSVSGLSNVLNPNLAYPISSFGGYVTGYLSGSNTILPSNTPQSCTSGNPLANGTGNKSSYYPGTIQGGGAVGSCGTGWTSTMTGWRVCLQVSTSLGDVETLWGQKQVVGAYEGGYIPAQAQWGKYVTLGAFTRCASANEQSGSIYNSTPTSMGVWAQ